MNGLLESRVLGNLQARFGGGETEKGSLSDTLAGSLPYKEVEQKYEVGMLKYLNQWAKLQDFPGRMVDWDQDQVKLAYDEGCRKLQSLQATTQEAYEDALSN